jgi:hypothetical protein
MGCPAFVAMVFKIARPTVFAAQICKSAPCGSVLLAALPQLDEPIFLSCIDRAVRGGNCKTGHVECTHSRLLWRRDRRDRESNQHGILWPIPISLSGNAVRNRLCGVAARCTCGTGANVL